MNGDAYLDLAVGIAVNNVGHCHPRVVEAIQKQCAELIHTSVTVHHKRYIELAKKLVEITPKSLDSVFLANSGAEAVEGAIKLARYATGRPGIIIFRGSFHGRTLLTTALTTSKLYYREKYEPLPSSIFTVPFPYVYRSHFKNDPDACVQHCLSELDDLFHRIVHPEQVAAIVIEPIQGEGGYVVPPKGFISALRKVADDHGILLIIDEVQSGFGRTGKMFAHEWAGVAPDVMCVAKAIGGGFPLGACLATEDAASGMVAGTHGSTYGGNPLAMAVGIAAVDIISQPAFLENVRTQAAALHGELEKVIARHPSIFVELRGVGMMLGLRCADNIVNLDLVNALRHHGLLSVGAAENVIRLLPPLIIGSSEIAEACAIIDKTASELTAASAATQV